MKRKTTKEILAESFRELAENHPVNKITIQEIVDNCGFSPATFYRHFRDNDHLHGLRSDQGPWKTGGCKYR